MARRGKPAVRGGKADSRLAQTSPPTAQDHKPSPSWARLRLRDLSSAPHSPLIATLLLPRVLVPPPLRPLPSTLWPYLPGIRSQHWHAGQFPPPPGPRRPHLRGTLQLHLELRQLQCGLGQGLAKSFVLTAQLCIQLGAPGGGTRGSGLAG